MATSPERKLKCPMCGHKSLGYNIEKKVGRCFRGTCGWTCNHVSLERAMGFDPTFTLQLESNLLIPHVALSAEQEAFQPADYKKEDLLCPYQNDALASWALEQDRSCWKGDVDNVMFDRATNRLWFHIQPIGTTPWSEEAVYFPLNKPHRASYITRSVFRSQKGWRREGELRDNCVFGHLLPTLELPYIILVEGVWDVLTPRMNGHALALLGTNMSHEQEAWLVRQQLPVLIWMDEDEAGLKATEEIYSRLKGMVPALRVFHEREPGDCTPEEARWVIQNAMGKAWW